MIVQEYTGWPTGVNSIVLDGSSVKIGEGALKNDTLESGLIRGSLRNSYVPDVFPVTMEFDWEIKDEQGETEYTRFIKWYKYIHKFGLIPFEFPQILYSPVTGITVVDINSQSYKVEYYKITSAIEGSKSGTKVKMNMTWKSVYSGVVQVETQPEQIHDLLLFDNHCSIIFSSLSNVNPVSNNFKIYIDNFDVETEKLGYFYNDAIASIYFPPLTPGSHSITFEYNSPTLIVKKGEFIATADI